MHVLVHGGGMTGRFWDRLLPYLDRPAIAVDLPGRAGKPADLPTLTVDDEVASVLADLGHLADAAVVEPVTVVAHSSGGLVVPGVVTGLVALGVPVERIVLDAALVPPEGGNGADCMQDRHREGLVAALAVAAESGDVITLPGPPADPEPSRHAYGGEPLDDETLAYVVDPIRCVPDTVNHYFQPVSWAPLAGTPVTYVLNTKDRPVRPERQEEMAARLPGPVTIGRVDAGHLFPILEPARFAAILAGSHDPGPSRADHRGAASAR